MLETILGGLLGAALGVLLYRLGWCAARRTPRGGVVTAARLSEAKSSDAASGIAPLTSQELYNFLNYDGGEMPSEAEEQKQA